MSVCQAFYFSLHLIDKPQRNAGKELIFLKASSGIIVYERLVLDSV